MLQARDTSKIAVCAALAASALWAAPGMALTVEPGAIKYFTVNLRHGTTLDQERLVASYLRRYGLHVDERDRRVLFVRGTYAQAAASAGTGFELATDRAGRRFIRTTSAARFPDEVAAHVHATTLSDGPPPSRSSVQPSFTLLPQYGYTPAALATYYDAASLYAGGTTGAGQAVAIIDCGAAVSQAVSFFESKFGFNSSITVKDVDTSSPGTSIFAETDLEAMISAAPGASITLYAAPSNCTFSELADAYAAVEADMATSHYASVTSEWWGSEDYYDSAGLDSVLQAEDADIQNIANAGGTAFADSGVYGAGVAPQELLSAGEFSAAFPASDPYAVGVGGTSAIPQSASTFTRAFELAWGYSGGGVSHEFSIPAYQQKLKGAASNTMRNVPDVAYDGDENTCATVYVTLNPREHPMEACFGGTYLGVAAWGGFLALVDQARAAAGKSVLTNVPANLYGAASKGGAFVRISAGCNDYYCAGKNPYSNVTGLGVPDVANLVSTLTALP
jgi:subtilase family serine protease